MAYGQWVVDEEATKLEFGYYSNELSKGSKKPVKCRCLECNIIANKRFRESSAKHKCESIINGEKKCFKCGSKKQVEEFSKNRSTFDGYQKVCKECFANYDSVKKNYKEKSNKLKSDLNTYLRNKTSGFERKCKLKNIDFNLTKDFIFEFRVQETPLGVPIANYLDWQFTLSKASDNSQMLYFGFYENSGNMWIAIYTASDSVLTASLGVTVSDFWDNQNFKYQLRYINNIMYLYVDNVLKQTFSQAFANDLKLNLNITTYDILNKKYIELP